MKYNTAIKAQPALSREDLKTHRFLFLTTFCFGLVLVVTSIVWWWSFKPRIYSFKAMIQNLHPQDELAADTYYFKKTLRPSINHDESAGLLRNEEFIIESRKPFQRGQRFELDFSKDQRPRSKLWITYQADDDEPIYEVDYDEKKGSFLKPADSPTTTSEWRLGIEASAFAAELPQDVHAQTQQPRKATTANKTLGRPRGTEIDKPEVKAIAVLQDAHANVGDKLDAIASLGSRPVEDLRQDLRLQFAEEPLAQTVFDLTQHSDPELASKAKLLADRLDIDGYLVQELSAKDRERRIAAGEILLRISARHAQALLKRVDTASYDDLRRLAADIAAGTKTRVLKPTASAQGDRYYVKATWNPNSSQAVSCLTDLFNTGLENSRTRAQEKALMQGKSQRFVYWYSKDWALGIADEISKCGGNAQFVLGY